MTPRRGFILDLNKCTGCHACETACQIENGLPAEGRWRRVRTFNELHVHGVEVVHLSLACNHCAAAPCMDACPARAVHRDEATGAVLIDEDECIGCRYCAWACPYGAPRLDETRGVMAKCDFCIERQRAGGEPACVTACPTGALCWGALQDAASASGEPIRPGLTQEVPGMTDSGADPSIRVVSLAAGRRAPRQTERPATPPWRTAAAHIVPEITFGGEWALAIFTLLASALVGVFLASRLGAFVPGLRLFASNSAAATGGAAGWARSAGAGLHLGAALFLAIGAGGLLASASHLRRRTRAWRAALHAERSWLSREIVLFIAFLALGALTLFLEASFAAAGRPLARWPHGWSAEPSAREVQSLALAAVLILGWLAAALGGAALIAAGRVYRFTRVRGARPLHSAHLLLTGLFLAAAWAAATWSRAAGGDVAAASAPRHAWPWAAVAAAAAVTAIAAIKAALYLTRKRSRRLTSFAAPEPARRARAWAPVLRIGLLGAGVAAIWLEAPLAAAFALLLSAELIDRAEYYNEMETTSPESLMLEELDSRARTAAISGERECAP